MKIKWPTGTILLARRRARVIDPTKVTGTALANAARVATLIAEKQGRQERGEPRNSREPALADGRGCGLRQLPLDLRRFNAHHQLAPVRFGR